MLYIKGDESFLVLSRLYNNYTYFLMMKYFLLVTLPFAFLACSQTPKSVEVIVDTVYELAPQYKYGICIDSMQVYHGEVERDENISTILGKFSVGGNIINELAVRSKAVYDLRKIKIGNIYAVFFDKDTNSSRVAYFVYEIDPVQYLVCQFGDSISVHLEQKDIRTEMVEASGVIESSLWNCMKINGLPPMLAIELSEIYAWTIDFFAIQKGDHFRVVYTESFVDSLSIGITGICYAVFSNAGQNIYAIPFDQDSVSGFFDSTGTSLRKAFLKAPLRYSRISSRFSKRRLHPILRIVRPHWGVDYKAPAGTPVVTIGDGVVTMKAYKGAAGNIVKVRHNSLYESSYLHLAGFGKNIKVGARIKQGDVVGYVGSTGLSTGAHLDFRIFKNGVPVDPLKVESPSVDPVKPERKAAFNIIRDSVVKRLSAITVHE